VFNLCHFILCMLSGLLGLLPLTTHANITTWQALGIGDPPGFVLEACATQRNLSSEGQAHAVAAGQALRERVVAIDAVYSSQWCRGICC